ncbi:MAG: hypothetical protein C4340_02210 [Armatimonadota bacterium]
MLGNYTVLTPEKTVLEYRIAGLGSRIWAFLFDLFVLMVYAYLLAMGTTALALLSPAFGLAVLIVGILMIPFGYHLLFELFWNGQTPGKRVFRIRVRMWDGTPITPAAAFLRNVLRLVDILPGTYTLGLTVMFFTERSQRLGDLAAGTVVVHEAPFQDRIVLSSGLTSAEHPLEGLIGSVRSLSPDEYVALKTLCDRYPELPAAVQEQMLRDVWEPIALRHNFPTFEHIHPAWLMEAIVMRYAREKGFL